MLAPEDPFSRYLAACDVIFTLPSGAVTTLAALSGKPIVHLPTSDGWQRQTAQFFSSRGLSLAGNGESESALLALTLAKDETLKSAMRNKMQLSRMQSAAPRVIRFLHEGRL